MGGLCLQKLSPEIIQNLFIQYPHTFTLLMARTAIRYPGWDPNFAKRTSWSWPNLLIAVAPWPVWFESRPMVRFMTHSKLLKLVASAMSIWVMHQLSLSMVMRQAECDLRLSPVYFNNPAFKRATEPQAVAHHHIMFFMPMSFPSKWSRNVTCMDNGSCALRWTFIEHTIPPPASAAAATSLLLS